MLALSDISPASSAHDLEDVVESFLTSSSYEVYIGSDTAQLVIDI